MSTCSWNLIFDPAQVSGGCSRCFQEPFALDARLLTTDQIRHNDRASSKARWRTRPRDVSAMTASEMMLRAVSR